MTDTQRDPIDIPNPFIEMNRDVLPQFLHDMREIVVESNSRSVAT
jgi:hypothetical protein